MFHGSWRIECKIVTGSQVVEWSSMSHKRLAGENLLPTNAWNLCILAPAWFERKEDIGSMIWPATEPNCLLSWWLDWPYPNCYLRASLSCLYEVVFWIIVWGSRWRQLLFKTPCLWLIPPPSRQHWSPCPQHFLLLITGCEDFCPLDGTTL